MWTKCNSCKSEIDYNTPYWVCSVSTCNGKRTGLKFCSVSCWEKHVPGARHKSAFAIEEKAPSKEKAMQQAQVNEAPKRRIIPSTPTQQVSSSSLAPADKEVLIVASKLKAYIKARSDMNTSASVMNALSDIVRRESDKAIEKARADGRKTVLDRDFK